MLSGMEDCSYKERLDSQVYSYRNQEVEGDLTGVYTIMRGVEGQFESLTQGTLSKVELVSGIALFSTPHH